MQTFFLLLLRALYNSQLNWAILLCESYLMEKLSKLHSFDRQYNRPQKCPFQSSFTQRTAQFTQGIIQFPQFTCRHHDGIIHSQKVYIILHLFLVIHSADEHGTIYSFSNTTSYCTFYAFFSSFWITWPTCLANSKRPP